MFKRLTQPVAWIHGCLFTWLLSVVKQITMLFGYEAAAVFLFQ